MTGTTAYSRMQIALHWGIAALIGVNYVVSEGMEDVFDARMTGSLSSTANSAVHVYVGIAVMVLVVLRLILRLVRGAPAAVHSNKPLMDMTAKGAHAALYVLMLAVPALGAISWFGGVDATAEIHVLAVNVMMSIVLVHAAAALFHQLVLRDGLLSRMVRGR
ncbi:MAG: cytochrome b/b6 domain-containing protein [Sideroxyarcus sp.]|nr:cytochrome b/b6 domain-containing protein [Sideroxyarcus sp.]